MPSRGGVRGGKDQFDWEDVKGDKYRENYLGHSLKAPIGHVHKVREQNWYMRNGELDKQERLNEEIRLIKEMESRGMAIAMGQEDTEGERKGESVSISDKMVKEILGVNSSGKERKEKKKHKQEKKEKKKLKKELKIDTKGLTNKSKKHKRS